MSYEVLAVGVFSYAFGWVMGRILLRREHAQANLHIIAVTNAVQNKAHVDEMLRELERMKENSK